MGAKSYIDALLLRGQSLAIGEISDSDKVGWAFFKLMNFEDVALHYDLFTSLVGGSASSSILAETATEWWRLLNENDDDVIQEEDTNKILQVFRGIYPPQLRMFMQYPEGTPRGRLSGISIPATPTALTQGYVNGYMSPFENPTDLGQLFTLQDMRVFFAWYNPEPATDYAGDSYYLKPELMLQMRRFSVKPYNPEKDMQQIKQMFCGAKRCTFWSPGLDPIVYGLKTKYGIEPTPWPGVD